MYRFIFTLSMIMVGSYCFAIDMQRNRLTPQIVTTAGEAKTFLGPHILLNIHLEKLKGDQVLKFELINKEAFNIGLLEFDFETLGNKGRIEFDTLPTGKSIVKAFKVNNVYDPKLNQFSLFDTDANERFSRVIIQFVTPKSKL